MKFWKDWLAQEIHEGITYEDLCQMQDRYPQLRVRTKDVQGKVPEINLSMKDGWWKPSEWKREHRRQITAMIRELDQRLDVIDCAGANPTATVKVTIIGEDEERTSQEKAFVAVWRLISALRESECKDLTDWVARVEDAMDNGESLSVAGNPFSGDPYANWR